MTKLVVETGLAPETFLFITAIEMSAFFSLPYRTYPRLREVDQVES